MSAVLETRGLEHIGLFAHDTVGLAQWYITVFGATEVSRSPESAPIVFLSFGNGSLIELIPASPPPAGEKDHVHICFVVDDIHAAVAALRKQEIELTKEIFRAYDETEVAFFHDPEGNLIQLAERPKTSPIRKAVFGT